MLAKAVLLALIADEHALSVGAPHPPIVLGSIVAPGSTGNVTSVDEQDSVVVSSLPTNGKSLVLEDLGGPSSFGPQPGPLSPDVGCVGPIIDTTNQSSHEPRTDSSPTPGPCHRTDQLYEIK
jgi:hypothetical protein